jgi:hypothetical protein
MITAPGVLSNDSDTEEEPLTAVLVDDPANGTLTLNADGSFDYVPFPTFIGIDSFTYKAFDGADYSDVATASITVIACQYFPGQPEGMISYWRFDSGIETIAYDSVGTNNGNINGATWTTGKVGGALFFDGIDDFVNCGNDESLQPLEQITLEAWIKIIGEKDHEVIFKGDTQYEPFFMRIVKQVDPPYRLAGYIRTSYPKGVGADGISLGNWQSGQYSYSPIRIKLRVTG